nr:uncharacterized protein LOC127487785 [Oryctolagus cuniculus]
MASPRKNPMHAVQVLPGHPPKLTAQPEKCGTPGTQLPTNGSSAEQQLPCAGKGQGTWDPGCQATPQVRATGDTGMCCASSEMATTDSRDGLLEAQRPVTVFSHGFHQLPLPTLGRPAHTLTISGFKRPHLRWHQVGRVRGKAWIQVSRVLPFTQLEALSGPDHATCKRPLQSSLSGILWGCFLEHAVTCCRCGTEPRKPSRGTKLCKPQALRASARRGVRATQTTAGRLRTSRAPSPHIGAGRGADLRGERGSPQFRTPAADSTHQHWKARNKACCPEASLPGTTLMLRSTCGSSSSSRLVTGGSQEQLSRQHSLRGGKMSLRRPDQLSVKQNECCYYSKRRS